MLLCPLAWTTRTGKGWHLASKKSWALVLCQAAGHQSPQEVADYQASHASRRLLKGYPAGPCRWRLLWNLVWWHWLIGGMPRDRKASAAAGSSKRTLAISAVRPLGPGAVPFLALARLCRMSCSGSCSGVSGVKLRMSLPSGWRGCCGLAMGLVSSRKVSSLPGASGAA